MKKRPSQESGVRKDERALLAMIGAGALGLVGAFGLSMLDKGQVAADLSGSWGAEEFEPEVERIVTRLGGIMGEIRDPEDELPGPDEHFLSLSDDETPWILSDYEIHNAIRDCIESTGAYGCTSDSRGDTCTTLYTPTSVTVYFEQLWGDYSSDGGRLVR